MLSTSLIPAIKTNNIHYISLDISRYYKVNIIFNTSTPIWYCSYVLKSENIWNHVTLPIQERKTQKYFLWLHHINIQHNTSSSAFGHIHHPFGHWIYSICFFCRNGYYSHGHQAAHNKHRMDWCPTVFPLIKSLRINYQQTSWQQATCMTKRDLFLSKP